jgi:anti-sigma factor RsiW
MTRDEVRTLFTRELDGELMPEERAELERALSADQDLRRELTELRRFVSAAAALRDTAPRVDLLGPVQHKLRARSGGRFYPDRLAEKRGPSRLLTTCLL